jgi:hypothetical protein
VSSGRRKNAASEADEGRRAHGRIVVDARTHPAGDRVPAFAFVRSNQATSTQYPGTNEGKTRLVGDSARRASFLFGTLFSALNAAREALPREHAKGISARFARDFFVISPPRFCWSPRLRPGRARALASIVK